MATENLLNLKIHKLSQQQYDDLVNPSKPGTVDQTALYLTPDNHSHTFTGAGTVIKGSFKGMEQTASVSYTPAGAISTPNITVAPTNTTTNKVTNVGSAPELVYMDTTPDAITSWDAGELPSLELSQGTPPSATFTKGSGSASLSCTVSTGPNRIVTLELTHTHVASTLDFQSGDFPTATFSKGKLPALTYSEVASTKISGWNPGSVPTVEDQTVVTGISATSDTPTFTGTAATISHTHTPSGIITISTNRPGSGETANYTPAGTVSQPRSSDTVATVDTSQPNA